MQRPIGIFVAGVILLISGLLGLLIFSLGLLGSVSAQTSQMAAMPYGRFSVLPTEVAFAVISIFVCWVAVDLFRMRSWARIAAIILAALGACFCGLFAVAMAVLRSMSLPNLTSQMAHGFLDALAIFYFVLTAIALFWIFYFNREPVRAAFTAASTHHRGQDAVEGIVLPIPQQHAVVGLAQIIVWINAGLWLIGCVSMFFLLFLDAPMFLFGWLATGSAAFLMEALFACLLLYAGLGLIFRWRGGWYLAIVLQLFSLVSVLFLLIPGYTARLFAASQVFAMRFAPSAPLDPLNSTSIAVISAVGGFITLVVLAALVRCRRSYLS